LKYCVLCCAEYLDSITICATCHSLLVRSLDSEEAIANPACLLWAGKDREEFELVACALREGEIPAFVEERIAGIGGFGWSQSRIHVLSADFNRALSAASNAVKSAGRVYNPKQTCYACAQQGSAFLAACSFCGAILVVEQKNRSQAGLSSSAREQSVLKYCPLCDAEYSDAHTRCSVCGVELVPEEFRGRPLDEQQRRERIELVWRGGDPGAVSEVIEILRAAGIRHHVQPTNDHFVFELGMPRPKYVVRTFASDAARAKELLAGIQDSSPFVAMEASALALADEPLEEQARSKHKWRPAAATLEIWSGEDAALAQLLQDCLRENGIGVRSQGMPPGIVQLRIMPSDEAAAREIIREVRDASPPA
jgi:hypothetical protein